MLCDESRKKKNNQGWRAKILQRLSPPRWGKLLEKVRPMKENKGKKKPARNHVGVLT